MLKRAALAAMLGLSVSAAAAAAFAVGKLSFDDPQAAWANMPLPPSGDRIRFSESRLPQLQLPDGTRQQVRSILNIARPMKYGDFVWNEAAVPLGEMLVRVDLRAQTLAVFRGGHEIGAAVILYGADGKPTPGGIYPILEKRERHRSSLYDAEMPYTLRLTNDGIAIHGSDVRPGAATHGCIGVPTEFAGMLFKAVGRGDRVVILS